MPTTEDQSTEALLQMGWYLDTSLFQDFVNRNIRTAFDTAEEYDGHTLLRITGLNKVGMRSFMPALGGGKRYQFELTKTINYLQLTQYLFGTTFFYSELTKAEVIRALRAAHSGREKAEILSWWDAFRYIISNYQKVDIDFHLDEELSDLALHFPIRKNAQDYIHLITARKKGLAFVTADKLADQIAELRLNFYQHIYYWPTFKEKIPIPDEFKQLLDKM